MSANYMHYKETQYGFEWGAVKIERICSDGKKGWVVLGIETPKHPNSSLQIYVTKTGKVRISDKNGEWKQPEKRKQKGTKCKLLSSNKKGERWQNEQKH